MTVLVRIFCGPCGKPAGVGLTPDHAISNIVATGGRVIGGRVNVCSGCAKATV